MNNSTTFLKIGKGTFLNKSKIFLLSNEINSRPIIEFREELKKENKIIKLTGGKEAKSFLLLENGYIIILPNKSEEIMKEINNSQ